MPGWRCCRVPARGAADKPAPAPQAPEMKVPEIRVSFDPIQREDQSAKGMLLWMQRQLGIGGQVDRLA